MKKKVTEGINISAQNLFLLFEFSSDDDTRVEAMELACFVLPQRCTKQELACLHTPGPFSPSFLLCLQLKDLLSQIGKEAGKRQISSWMHAKRGQAGKFRNYHQVLHHKNKGDVFVQQHLLNTKALVA